MAKQNENTALAVQNGGYLALANFDFDTDISEVLDGLNISFGKIKIQTGAYEVPKAVAAPCSDGDTDAVQEFSGVILFNHPLNMYYKTDYNGGNTPPDCGSFDGKTGTGDLPAWLTSGGNCKKCPFNQFGTAKDSKGNPTKGKACKNRQRVYVLREGEVFPVLLSLPTGSLKGYTEYLQRNLSKGLKPWQYVTRFSLRKATNAGGISFSQAAFHKDRDMTKQELTVIAPFAEQIKAYARHVGFEADNAVIADEDGYEVDTETGEVIEGL